MPSKTPAQARLMAACSHGAGYSSCPPEKVATEFNQADKGSKLLSNAMKKAEGGGLSKERKIILIRHGATHLNSTENNSVDRIRGWSDVPLSDEGRKEASTTGDQLKGAGIQKLVHSDLQRASETAKIIAKKLGVPIEADHKLRPWSLGKFTGQSTKEVLPKIAEYVIHKPHVAVPEGESFNTFKKRVFDGLQEIFNKHPDTNLGLVTHHRVERLLKAWIANGSPPDYSIKVPEFLKKGEKPGSAEPMTIKKNGYARGGTVKKRDDGGDVVPSAWGQGRYGTMSGAPPPTRTPFHGPTIADMATGMGRGIMDWANLTTKFLRPSLPDPEEPVVKKLGLPDNAYVDASRLATNLAAPGAGGLTSLVERGGQGVARAAANPEMFNPVQWERMLGSNIEDTNALPSGGFGEVPEGVNANDVPLTPAQETKPTLTQQLREIHQNAPKVYPKRGAQPLTGDALAKRRAYYAKVARTSPAESPPEFDIPSYFNNQRALGLTLPRMAPGGAVDDTNYMQPSMFDPGVPQGAIQAFMGPRMRLTGGMRPRINIGQPIDIGQVAAQAGAVTPGGMAGGGRMPLYRPFGGQVESPFTQGLPVEDVGDVVDFNKYLHSPDLLANQQMHSQTNLPPRTYYGGASARLGTPEGNAAYEQANGLKPGSLVQSNAGRGDIVPSSHKFLPNTSKAMDDLNRYVKAENIVRDQGMGENHPKFLDSVLQVYQALQHGETPDNFKASGGGINRPYGGQVEKAANIPITPMMPPDQFQQFQSDLYNHLANTTPNPGQVMRGVRPEDRMYLLKQQKQWLNGEPFHEYAKGGALPGAFTAPKAAGPSFGGKMPPALPKAKGMPPESIMTERSAGIGLARKASGFIHSPSPGRADNIGVGIRSGSYVIPADTVSHFGQGNSLAGANALNILFKQGPYGSGYATGRMPRLPGFIHPTLRPAKTQAQGGGLEHEVPVNISGGEYVVEPETVARIGGGNPERGFRVLDKLVLNSRKKNIDVLKKIKPPKKD